MIGASLGLWNSRRAGGPDTSWLQPGGPAAQLDLAAGRAWAGGTVYLTEGGIKSLFSTYQTPAGFVLDVDGKYRWVPANSVHSFQMPEGKNRGLGLYRASTNKCEHHNAVSPAAVAMGSAGAFNAASVPGLSAGGGDANTLFGVVDDSAAMTDMLSVALANGWIDGLAVKIDNSAGGNFAYLTITGFTGNTLQHIISSLIRGSGLATATLGNTTAGVAITSNYAPYSVLRTPSNGLQTATLRVEPGGVAYFKLTQLEEGSTPTPPIPVSGASASRGAFNLVALDGTPLATAAQNAKSMFFQTSNVTGSNGPRMIQFGGGAVCNFFSSTKVRAFNFTTPKDATIGAGGTFADVVKSAFAMDATSYSVKANGGVIAEEFSAWAGNTGNVYFGDAPALDRSLDGYLNRATFWNTKGLANGLTV